MQTLENRTCVFAGATGNIGRGAVRALAEGGMNVVMVTHNPAGAAAIIEEMQNLPGRVVAMSNANGDGAVFGDVEKEFGSVDVVINTTGGLDAVADFEKVNPDHLDEKLSHQVTEPFKMVQAAMPFLKKSSAGRVILTATEGAVDGFTGENIIDSIARGGVLTMTRALARLLADQGITVNCIARSGMINDHEPQRATDYDVRSIEDQIPVGHAGTADEFGALVAYIASVESGFVTGQIFHLSGGLHI